MTLGPWRLRPDGVDCAPSVCFPARAHTTKAGIYATAAIPEYWILNLPQRHLEVHRQPSVAREQPLGWAYASVTVLGENDTVSPLSAPEARIRVGDLLLRGRDS